MAYNLSMCPDVSDSQGKAVQITRRRLCLIWMLWTLGTVTGVGLFSLSFQAMFPFHLSTGANVQLSLSAMLFGVVFGASVGLHVGLLQFLVLKYLVPGHQWLLWILLTVVGFGIAFSLEMWFKPDYFSTNYIVFQRVGLSALMGLVIGGIQAPLLAHRFPGIRWYIWIAANILAWPICNDFRKFILIKLSDEYTGLILSSPILGMTTGTLLVLYVRQTSKKAVA